MTGTRFEIDVADCSQPIRVPASDRLRLAIIGIQIMALAVALLSVQAAVFYSSFAPRVDAANAVYAALSVEQSDRGGYRDLEERFRILRELTAAHGDDGGDVVDAWQEFSQNFLLTPQESIAALRQAIDELEPGTAEKDVIVEQIVASLNGLQRVYADPFRELQATLEEPPIYWLPAFSLLADHSGFRTAVTLNRALYLAQLGELGTATVLLTGLHASTDDRHLLGLINYALGRLQFELMQTRADNEFHGQAVAYLQRSLRANPDSMLSRQFLDYLLSLNQQNAVLEVGAGTPASNADGDGTAIPTKKPKF